jgi:hypothetical protein
MGVKIQINSIEALDRLLGNDTALELELRRAVVEEFTGCYLKPVAESPIFQEELRLIRKKMEEAVDSVMGDEVKKIVMHTWTGQEYKLKLRGDIEEGLRNYITEQMVELLQGEVRKIRESLKEHLAEQIASTLPPTTQVIVDEVKKQIAKKLMEL